MKRRSSLQRRRLRVHMLYQPLVPLRPPTTTEAESSAYVSVSQIVTGRKAAELDFIRESIMRPQPLLKIPTSKPVVILQATSNTSRDLAICSAYDVINQSTIIHAQQLKDMMLEINSAKKLKIPKEVPKATMTNPNLSCGLFVTAKIC